MKYGYKRWSNGILTIEVDGCNKMRYLWYTEREAVKKYREANGLKYKKIIWY